MATLTRTMTYAELVAAISAGTLNKGESITISDFATTHYFLDGDLALLEEAPNVATPEPLTVLAINNNTIDCVAKSSLYPQDIIHYDWNPDNWINDRSFSDVDNSGFGNGTIIEGFKGVITYREDTIQKNKTYYDFRGVKFRRWALNPENWSSGTTYSRNDYVKNGNEIYRSIRDNNTNHALVEQAWWVQVLDTSKTVYWSWSSSNMNGCQVNPTDYIDCPTWVSYIEAADNEIGLKHNYLDDPTVNTILPNIVFVEEGELMGTYAVASNKIQGGSYFGNSSIGAGFNSNSIGANFNSNSIGANFYSNSIGAYFFSNSIGASFNFNSIGAYFFSNSIGANFNSNSIGAYFFSNSIGASFFSNSIGANFNSNSIGAYFYSNSIGAYFNFNSIGASFNFNSIGAGFNSNSIGDNFYSNSIGAYFQQNTIADNFNNVAGSSIGVDFVAATHVYAQYTCTLFTRVDGTPRLKYCNNSDVEVIVAANA